MLIIRILLLPISIFYGLAMQIRNYLYDIGLFKTYKFSRPVISVGNIAAGGTGKTPFTIYLANVLIEKGKTVAVISRGYGRQSKGFQLVSDAVEKYGNTKLHGDEPVLISLKAPKAIVAVCEKRKKAIEILETKYKIDTFILDDAFQHRSVYRDVDIVLVQKKSFINRLVIPSGILREFYFNLKRANLLISRDKNYLNAVHGTFKLSGLFDLNFMDITLNKLDAGVIAFAGIANPQNFKNGLLEKNITIKTFIPYKDHYAFVEQDIDFLLGLCSLNDVATLLCTEKDIIKIREIPKVQEKFSKSNVSIYAFGYTVKVDDENSLLKKVLLP